MEVVRGSTPQQCALLLALLRCSRIQDHQPADTPLVGWQSEGQRFMMGVQEHKEHVVQPPSANRDFIRV